MINHEKELKLQAYLDGELPADEANAIADLLGRDAGAQALYQELRVAKSLLAGNELERTLSESREFYWSKIQRQIDRAIDAGGRTDRTVSISLVAPVFGPGGCAGGTSGLCGCGSAKPGRRRDISGPG